GAGPARPRRIVRRIRGPSPGATGSRDARPPACGTSAARGRGPPASSGRRHVGTEPVCPRSNLHRRSVPRARDASLPSAGPFVSRPERRAPRGWLVWGVGAMRLYLAAALWAQDEGVPVRLLYDGFAPPLPYRWVRPPARLAAENQPPEAGAGSIALRAGSESEYASIGTGDGQAFVIFPPDAVAPSNHEAAARVTLVPLDPAR